MDASHVQAQESGGKLGAFDVEPKLTSIWGGRGLQHGLGSTMRSARWFVTVMATVPRPFWS